ncbi:MAG: rhodanese-like domain-containing protein [Chromatiales bacterium]|jgi:rhodanese-related sulfurtransferase
MKLICLISAMLAFCATPAISVADGLDGNRYSADLERDYRSEISASAAYLAAMNDGAVIIDVRTIEEYVGGHPPGAYSIPFPHVNNRQCSNPESPCHGDYIGQTPEDFVNAVNGLGLPKDTQIITMCRTGFRSVLAGNLLAGDDYTNVQNMWEGFKGKVKQNEGITIEDIRGKGEIDDEKFTFKGASVDVLGEDLDLDGDGEVTGSDPYSLDLDGWANFAGLPVSFDLNPDQLRDPNYPDLYYNVVGIR